MQSHPFIFTKSCDIQILTWLTTKSVGLYILYQMLMEINKPSLNAKQKIAKSRDY